MVAQHSMLHLNIASKRIIKSKDITLIIWNSKKPRQIPVITEADLVPETAKEVRQIRPDARPFNVGMVEKLLTSN